MVSFLPYLVVLGKTGEAQVANVFLQFLPTNRLLVRSISFHRGELKGHVRTTATNRLDTQSSLRAFSHRLERAEFASGGGRTRRAGERGFEPVAQGNVIYS